MRVSQQQNKGRILLHEKLVRVNQDIMAMEKLARDFLVGEGYMPADMWDDKGSPGTLAAAVMVRVNPLTDLIEQSAEAIQDVATDTKKETMVMYSMWAEFRVEMQKVTDTTKEELMGVVEETRDEIHKAIRGTKDRL